MTDLTNPIAIKVKGFLFLFLGIFAATLLLCLHPEWRVAPALGRGDLVVLPLLLLRVLRHRKVRRYELPVRGALVLCPLPDRRTAAALTSRPLHLESCD